MIRREHTNPDKQRIEVAFWESHSESNFIGMRDACTKMARINDGDSFRLFKVMKVKEAEVCNVK